jgi:hypothetical protein
LWLAFVLTHLWLGYLNLNAPGLPLGDVSFVYKYWAQEASYNHFYVGIDSVWVYPILAFLPMMAATAAGFANYEASWLSLVFILDAVAFAAMVGWNRPQKSFAIGWWWIAFLLLLGPIAMGRIDSITVPIAVVGVMFVATRPRVATLLFTLATWIKVWPAALIAAVLIASGARRRVFLTAALTSVGIVLIALAFGSGTNVFSFVSQQTGRGLQVEAPVSTIWMWMAFARVPGASVYYDTTILTYQVSGPGATTAAALMTPLLAIAVLGVAALGILAVRRGAPVPELLPPLGFGFITAFIAFNKVGSPQYMTWLAVPIILGLATHAAGYGRSFRAPAILVLVAAALTQAFYPYLYTSLLGLDPVLIGILTVRNLLVFAMLGWAASRLWHQSRPHVLHEKLFGDERWLPSVWPFSPPAYPELPPRRYDERGMLDERFTKE